MTPPPRRRLVGVSTKMYFSAARTNSYTTALTTALATTPTLTTNTDIFLLPDHLTLATVAAHLTTTHTPILPGAQDTFWEDTGAYTGATSPAVLAELGCRIVELGHAERRRLFGESDADVARKAAAVVRNGMVPLVCVGERSRGAVSMAVGDCAMQVDAVLGAVPGEAEVILAYEPVWAIGAAEPAGAEHVVGVVEAIRALPCVKGRKGLVRIIYGGSAGPGLFAKLSSAVDGLFLGRFAHDPEAFIQTIREVGAA